MAEVNAPANYYVSATNDVDGYTNYDYYEQVFVSPDAYSYVYNILFYPEAEYFTVSGYVYDQNDQPVPDASVDFSGIDAPANKSRYDYIRSLIKNIMPSLSWKEEDLWMGQRPSTSDSLPVIGRSTSMKNIYFAFPPNC